MLHEKLDAKYRNLTQDEIKTLVVDDKWLATLATAVQGELDRVSQTLTGRIRQLAERYATPLPLLTEEVALLAARVDGYLKKMGGGMELTSGYKLTEVGVVPTEWAVKQLGGLSTIATGSTPPTADASNYGRDFLFVSPVDLGETKYVTRTAKGQRKGSGFRATFLEIRCCSFVLVQRSANALSPQSN